VGALFKLIGTPLEPMKWISPAKTSYVRLGHAVAQHSSIVLLLLIVGSYKPISFRRVYFNCRSILSTGCWGSLGMVAGKTLWIGLNTYVLHQNGHQFFPFAQ
jgi:hypothetical protein